MRNFSLVIEKLNILRKAGFKVHLDDFCTGYSSMKYLKDLPVDSIKIDQEFVKYVNTNKVNNLFIILKPPFLYYYLIRLFKNSLLVLVECKQQQHSKHTTGNHFSNTNS